MNTAQKLLHFIKPWLLIIIVIGALQITGQLSKVVSFGQSAILKTGVLNATPEPQEDVQEMFDYHFDATTVDGLPFDTESLKNKVVFLNLWATWCGPCRAEMPTIQNLYNEIKPDDIVFVMLSIDRKDPVNKVKEYVVKNNYTFPVYILKGAPPTQLRVPSIPTTFIIDKKGNIIRKEVGMRRYDAEKFKKFLLKEAGKK